MSIKNLPDCVMETNRVRDESGIEWDEERIVAVPCSNCMKSIGADECFICNECGNVVCYGCIEETVVDIFICLECLPGHELRKQIKKKVARIKNSTIQRIQRLYHT